MRRSLLVCLALGMIVPACRESKTLGVFDGGPDTDASRLPQIDGGPPTDADTTPVGKIQQAKETADGPVNITIEAATVTYLKPSVGDEGAGFFVQAEEEGPGLFVGVDPDTLEPNPAVGDVVAFTITEMGSVSGGLRQAVSVEDYSRLSTGNAIEDFIQDVTSAADLVSGLAAYDSELIEIEATITGEFGFGGNGHRRAAIATTGVPESDEIALRIPEALETELNLGPGCSFRLVGVMWRFGGTAQPSGFVADDFQSVECADPQVTSAVAASETSVVVRFDRPLDPASVLGDGSQFSFDNGLTASAAVASGDQVTVTTSSQTPETAYTVTVASTVEDASGNGVDAANNSAVFTGFVAPAELLLSEINANISLGCDLVEIRVMSEGSVAGLQLWQRSDPVYTLPDVAVSSGDIIVIHLGKASNCNLTGAPDETASITGAAEADHAQNYDTAFDLYTDTGGLTATSNVVTLVDPVGNILDAVLLHNDDNNVAGASETRAAEVADAGEWTEVGGGVPAGGFVDADFVTHGVPGLQSTGTDASGTSIQRLDAADDDDKSDWTGAPAASSWGVASGG